jgi:hypothetical protein
LLVKSPELGNDGQTAGFMQLPRHFAEQRPASGIQGMLKFGGGTKASQFRTLRQRPCQVFTCGEGWF